MSATLVLYGSRARGDANSDSDVDLILAEEGSDIGVPHVTRGLSVHSYSKGWLLDRAREGNLFVYHVAFEGVALCDRNNFLTTLRENFRKKPSYFEERLDAILVLRALLETDWHSNSDLQRRYFWAMRTILICMSADRGDPCFSSVCLEKLSGIPGLATHINHRMSETYSNCLSVGSRIVELFGSDAVPSLSGALLRSYLLNKGGIARDTVHLIEHQDMSELGSGGTYL